MSGIERIKIEGTWHDWRTNIADAHTGVADKIYRDIFSKINMPLDDGVDFIKCTKDEAMSRYDWKEGIDVILYSGGAKMTLQEKCLTYWESTVTIEDIKTSGAKGAWYYCTAQYYMVGYTRKYIGDWKTNKVSDNPIIDFQDWMLIDFSAMKRADAAGLIKWEMKKNGKDGRGSSFRIARFNDIPSSCIIARA